MSETPNILVVDDSPDIRQVMARIVVPLGVNVLEAGNGRQALSILKKQRVDVVICDLVMPRMSGIMLLHSMLEQGLQIPFILATGYPDKDSAIQALRLGAFDYLEKPLAESDLQPVVAEALKVSREQRQLLDQVSSTRVTPFGVRQADANAELAIMKMRTFRFKGESYDYAVSKGNSGNWQDLLELFVREAEPQLVFSEGALAALTSSENVGRDLAFVLRVIQSVRMASEAIRLNDLAELAWSLEASVAAFRPFPEQLTAEHVTLMVAANKLLRDKVAALGAGEAREVQKSLEALTAALRNDPKAS